MYYHEGLVVCVECAQDHDVEKVLPGPPHLPVINKEYGSSDFDSHVLYAAVHLLKLVGACELCTRWCLAFNSCAHDYTYAFNVQFLLHACFLMTPGSGIKVCAIASYHYPYIPSLPISCTAYNFLLTWWGEPYVSVLFFGLEWDKLGDHVLGYHFQETGYIFKNPVTFWNKFLPKFIWTFFKQVSSISARALFFI